MTGIIRYGYLYAWGRNNQGQLGDGTKIDKLVPTKIGDMKWKDISFSSTHSLGITEDGDLYAWGMNNNGQLGDGTTVNKSVPTKIGNLKWSSVSTGSWNSSAITENGDLYTWGYNGYGQLGDGTKIDKLVPTKIGNLKWKKVVTGNNQTLAITTNDDLYGWGSSTQGNGLNEDKLVPTKIGILKWNTISLGATHSLGITTDGDLYTWGINTDGQLGDGTTINKLTPTKIGSMKWKDVKADYITSSAITENGDLYTWGYNGYGQLGDGTTINKLTPTKIGNLKWSNFIQSNNFNHSHFLAITEDNLLYAWGRNNQGQLGDGTTVDKLVPTFILYLILNKTLILQNGEYKKLIEEGFNYKKPLDTTVSANNKLTNYFKFDENSGNTTDSKGASIGTISGATRVVGFRGNALSFDGVDDYVQINQKIIPIGKKSIRFKIKTTMNSIGAVLNEAYNTSIYGSSLVGCVITVRPNGTIAIQKNNIGTSVYLESSKTINDGKWHDILITDTNDTSANGLKIFVDDMKKPNAQTTSIIQSAQSTSTTLIGRIYNGSSGRYDFKGELDELEIYNDTFTEDELFEKDIQWQSISSTLPTSTQFIEEGMDSLSPLFDRTVQNLIPQEMTLDSTFVGEGKLFRKSVDLNKYFDLRTITTETRNS